MTWKVRHEGSPQSIEGLTSEQVIEGLQDGVWELTDEIMGLHDQHWVAIENHPQFAYVAEQLAPLPETHDEGATHVDMNPMIDVSLVLLIFFMLTASYAALERLLEMPKLTTQGQQTPTKVPASVIRQLMVTVEAHKEHGRSVILVEGKPVEEKDLTAALRPYVGRRKTDLLLLAAGDVEWKTVVAIQDAAKNAGGREGPYPGGGAASAMRAFGKR